MTKKKKTTRKTTSDSSHKPPDPSKLDNTSIISDKTPPLIIHSNSTLISQTSPSPSVVETSTSSHSSEIAVNHTFSENSKPSIFSKNPFKNRTLSPPSYFKILRYVSVATLSHAFLHIFSSKILLSKLPPSIKARLTSSDFIYLPEKIPSTVSALFVGLGSLYLCVIKKSWKNDIFQRYPPFLDVILSAHVGFSIYDLIVMASIEKEHISIWIHHVLGVLGAAAMMIYRQAAFFPVAFMIPELTVITSNWLWVLQRFHLTESKWYQKALVARAVAFTLFRTFIFPVSIIYAINRESSNSAYWLKKLQDFKRKASKLPKLVLYFSIINVLTFGALNTWWSVLVYRSLYKKRIIKSLHHI